MEKKLSHKLLRSHQIQYHLNFILGQNQVVLQSIKRILQVFLSLEITDSLILFYSKIFINEYQF
jgi:hypothetical protein